MIDGEAYFASRLAWALMKGKWPAFMVDHEDLDTLNDRWSNLRPATNSQNRMNTTVRSDSATGIKGVYYDRHRGLYSAQVGKRGKRVFLGRFQTDEQAAAAYRAVAQQQHEDFFRE